MRHTWLGVVVAVAACSGGGDDDASIGPPGRLAIEPAVIDLGVVEIGVASAPRAVTIRNVGPVPTAVVLTTDAAALVVVTNDCVELAPQATCEATVAVTAAAADVRHELRAIAVSGETTVAPVTGQGAYRLAVERSGNGAVASTPAGIDCGASCSALFAPGTVVTLAALPAAVATFDGWDGACTGTGACAVTLDDHAQVRARFVSFDGLVIASSGLGAGAIEIEPGGFEGWEYCLRAPCMLPSSAGNTYQLAAHPLPGATFTGWSGGGCSGTGTCTVAVPATGATVVTAMFATEPGVGLVRTSPTGPTNPASAAAVPGGVLAVDRNHVVRFGDDGSHAVLVTDPDGYLGSIAVAPSGAFFLSVSRPVFPGSFTPELRAYDAAGAHLWTAPVTAMSVGGLQLDAAGNLYALGYDGAGYVASFTPAGVERWRHHPAEGTIVDLDVRGDRVLVATASQTWSRLYTYGLDGAAGWTRQLLPRPGSETLQLEAIELDADGDVVYAGTTYRGFHVEVGTVAAAGTAELWRTQLDGARFAQLHVDDGDLVRVWLGNDDGMGSRVVRLDEAGVAAAPVPVAGLTDLLASAGNGAGALYLFSKSDRYPFREYVMQKR